MVHFQVADIEASIARVQDLGWHQLSCPSKESPMAAWFSVVADPAGAPAFI